MNRQIKFQIIHKNKVAGVERLSANGWEWMWYELNPDKGERWTKGLMADSPNCIIIRRQFTGLLDKNGKEIYEGDIVEHNDEMYAVEYGIQGVDAFEGVGWNLWSFKDGIEATGERLTSEIEVIGNIYENPKLLKQPKNGETYEDTHFDPMHDW